MRVDTHVESSAFPRQIITLFFHIRNIPLVLYYIMCSGYIVYLLFWGSIWENITMIILSTSRMCPPMSRVAVVSERMNTALTMTGGSIEMRRADLFAAIPSRTERAVSQTRMITAAMIPDTGMTAATAEADITMSVITTEIIMTAVMIDTDMITLTLTEPAATATARRHPIAVIRGRATDGAEESRTCSAWRSSRSRCCS